jgi:hypothetical protein
MEHDSQPKVYCVHVWIREIHPMLWRRFLVRSDSTLADLHVVLLHRFRIRKKDYAVPRLAAGNALLEMAYTELGRQETVGETRRAYAAAAYSLLRLRRAPEAFLLLDEGKTRLMAEALALGDLDLQSLSEDQREAIRAKRQTIRELEAEMRFSANTPDRHTDRLLAESLYQVRHELRRLIETIRGIRPDFMSTKVDLAHLLRLVPVGGALVAPLITSQGGAVFVVPHGVGNITESEVVWIDDLTEQTIRELLKGPGDAWEWSGWIGAYVDRESEPQQWMKAIEKTGQRLWDIMLCHVHERLQKVGLGEGASIYLHASGRARTPASPRRMARGGRSEALSLGRLHGILCA